VWQILSMEDDDSTIIGKELVFKQFGSPQEVLEVEGEVLISLSPPPGDVLVRILAAPLNPADLNTIEGTYGVKPALPATPGIEGCGIVEASNSADFEAGDHVIFLRRASTWASHTTVPGTSLYKLPPGGCMASLSWKKARGSCKTSAIPPSAAA
jgi:trans-2-enoyl-CoA reductase